MSRSLTGPFKSAIFAQETDEVFLFILEIDHVNLESPIRVVNNYEAITSNGKDYLGYPFQITLPNQIENVLPSIFLTIDNVDRLIVEAIRECPSAPSIDISVILASAPDTVEAGPYSMKIREASYSKLTVRGKIMPDDIFNEPYPGVIITPQNYSSLFT